MKVTEFEVPIYGVQVTLIEIEGPKDAKEITPYLKWADASPSSVEDCLNAIKNNCMNGGDTWRNLLQRQIVCVIYKCESLKKKYEIIGHEKRHIEDRILQFFNVDDIESAGLLAGFLTTKMFNF